MISISFYSASSSIEPAATSIVGTPPRFFVVSLLKGLGADAVAAMNEFTREFLLIISSLYKVVDGEQIIKDSRTFSSPSQWPGSLIKASLNSY